MKNIITVSLLSLLTITQAHAGQFASRGKALDAAEAAYGNDPALSKVKTIRYDQTSETVVFHVAVGIGNAEDGQHNYEVKIAGSNSPVVTEIDRF